MKHRKFILAGVSCLFVGLTVLFSCKKNTECTGIIYTYTMQNGVKIPIGGCTLRIGDIKGDQEDRLDTNIMRVVVTDANGYYEGTWNRQVRLPIDAQRGSYYGIGIIDLNPGDVTRLEIPLMD